MTSGTAQVDYAYCGSTSFIPSKKILRIAEMIEEVKKGSRDPVARKKAFELARDVCSAPLAIKGMPDADILGIADAIFLWVRDRIAYINESGRRVFQSQLHGHWRSVPATVTTSPSCLPQCSGQSGLSRFS